MTIDPIDYKKMYDDSWSGALQNGRKHFGDDRQSLTFLKSSNLLDKNDAILEIGCGIGTLCQHLYNEGYRNIIGTDISSSSIDFGSKEYPHLTLQVMDGTKLEFESDSFDKVLSFDLVEHLPDIDTHFDETFRVLKPKGYYLFQTPNILSNSIAETLSTKGFEWKKYHPSLQFSWTLKKRLIKAGFDEIKFVRISPISDYKLKKLARPLRVAFKMIPWKYLPLFLQINFWCIAQKQ